MGKKRDDLIEILVEYFYNYKSTEPKIHLFWILDTSAAGKMDSVITGAFMRKPITG